MASVCWRVWARAPGVILLFCRAAERAWTFPFLTLFLSVIACRLSSTCLHANHFCTGSCFCCFHEMRLLTICFCDWSINYANDAFVRLHLLNIDKEEKHIFFSEQYWGTKLDTCRHFFHDFCTIQSAKSVFLTSFFPCLSSQPQFQNTIRNVMKLVKSALYLIEHRSVACLRLSWSSFLNLT